MEEHHLSRIHITNFLENAFHTLEKKLAIDRVPSLNRRIHETVSRAHDDILWIKLDLFNVEAEEKSGIYTHIYIYIYICWLVEESFPLIQWKIYQPAFCRAQCRGGGGRGGGALRSFNIFRQQTARVHLVIKSVWSANIAASMHAACLHRVAGPATGGGGGGERGEGERRGRKPFQPLCSTWLRNRFC